MCMDLIRGFLRFREHLLLVLLAVLAAALYAFFSYGLPWRFNSPDESANAYFTQRVARGEPIAAPDALNYVTQNPIVHPRSTHIVNGQLAPASFLGLPLILGFLGKLTGESALPYLTPLAAIIGLLAFWGIVKELANNKAAWLASFLLIVTPAWWYYHSRSFFHNAIFFDCLLLAIYLLVRAIKNKNGWLYLASGLSLGLSLALRTSEVFWILAAGIVWLGLNWRQVKWNFVLLTILGSVMLFSPVLVTNYQIYGSIFSVGYKQDLLIAGDFQQTLGLVEQLILPFGFHPRVILSTVTDYLISITWWWALLAGGGIIYWLAAWRKHSNQAKYFFIAVLMMIVWLVVVYGSWQFNDNPDPRAVTLGTSYVRYWLPIYAFLLWPAGLVLARILNWRWGKELVFFIIGSYAILSGLLVWAEPAEGLASIKNNIKKFEVWNQQVQDQTEPKSVIVTGLTDKIFWPERQVIYDLVNPADYVAVNKLLNAGTPIYWFHPTWPADGLVTMNKKLSDYGLALYPKAYGWQDFSLYEFSILP